MAAAQRAKRDELVFVPLGGVGEIGMNLYLYGVGRGQARKWLMIDLGVSFPGEKEPGVDLIFPDTRFIEEERTNLLGILLTHAHEDHFGAVMDLWSRLRAPVYATPFTAGLLTAKLNENSLNGEIPLEVVTLGSRFDIGPFNLELVNMAHSIPEPNAVVIRTSAGTAVHTGDWKLDPNPIVGVPTDEPRLRSIGAEGVDALICDSTNVLRDGVSPSEADVAETLAAIVAGARKRVAVTTFASNVARIRSVLAAAERAGRHVVIVGRAMHRIIQVAQETGHLPEDVELLTEEDYGYLPREEVVALCTGSQGEPRAALSRIAAGTHPRVSFASGDTVVFSSRTIPGNEKAVAAVHNDLSDLGVKIFSDADALVHVSGHPRRGELEQMYEWIKPASVVPMHGEARHLREHASFARARGVPHVAASRNGVMIRLAPDAADIIDDVPSGRLYKDGRLLVSADGSTVRERRKLSFVGLVAVSVVLDARGDVAADPQVALRGLPDTDMHGAALRDIALDAVAGALAGIPRPRRRDRETVGEAVRRAVRGAIYQAWGKRPICSVMVSVV
ncbi:MAG: ribonuclease J [Methyloligellaceae bacterium]